MSDPYFQRLFAQRIGGADYGKGTAIYKFERIKRAKRKALADHPERSLIDFGIGENDAPAAESVRQVMAVEINKPENRGYADNGILEFKQAVARFMARQFDVALDLDQPALASHATWQAVLRSKTAADMELRVELFLYGLEKLGVTDIKDNFRGDHKKAFEAIDARRKTAMENSKAYRVMQKK